MGRRITKLKITETSAVDRPANNMATVDSMTLVKRADAPEADMTNEEKGALRKFFTALFKGEPELAAHINKVAARKDVDEADKARAKKEYGDVKFADEKNKRYPIDSEAHVRAAWSYINMPKNAAKYAAADLKTIKGKIQAAGKKFGIKFSDDEKKADLPDDVLKAFETDPFLSLADSAEDIEKGMWTCSMVAGMLDQLDMIYQDAVAERVREGDDSKVPEMIKGVRDALAEAFVAMTQEESQEITEKTMALSEAAERLIKDCRENTGIFAKAAAAAPVATAKTETPALKAEDIDSIVKAINGANLGVTVIKMDAELQALTQGAHDSMMAAGAPPHHESADEMDADEAAKADLYIDMIKAAGGLDEAQKSDLTGLLEKAKFGKKVGEHLKNAHDLVTKIGAKCDAPGMGKALDSSTLQKMLDNAIAKATKGVEKQLAERDARIAALTEQVNKGVGEPQPLAMGPNGTFQLRAVDKSGATAEFVPAAQARPNQAPVTKAEPIVVDSANAIIPSVIKAHGSRRGVGGIEELLH